MTGKRYPLVAALFSLAVPGLGHLYAGYVEAAIVAYAAVVVSGGAFVASVLASSAAPNRAMGMLGVMALIALILILVAVVPIHAAWRAARQPATYELRRYNRWYVYAGIYLVFAGMLQPRVWADAKRRLEYAAAGTQSSVMWILVWRPEVTWNRVAEMLEETRRCAPTAVTGVRPPPNHLARRVRA
jgi:hypothetical protein